MFEYFQNCLGGKNKRSKNNKNSFSFSGSEVKWKVKNQHYLFNNDSTCQLVYGEGKLRRRKTRPQKREKR